MRTWLLLLWLAALPAAFAQPAEEAKKLAALEGRVVNAKTGEPLRRVNLTMRSSATGMRTSVPMASSAPYAASTDAEGKFRIEKIEPGTYMLYAERQGFVRQSYGARRAGMQGTNLKLSAGQEIKDLEFKLTPQAVITGRVVDEEGEPLARVSVQVLRRFYYQGQQRLMPSGGGQTTDTGEFRISELAPGRYWISANYRARMMAFGEAPRTSGDKPEEDYVITYYPGTADQAGARAIDVQAGQEIPGIDIRMQKTRVYRIRGKVAGEQAPRGTRLMLLPRDSGAPFMGFMGAGASVRPDGTFEIGGVAPGSYLITVMRMQGAGGTQGRVPVDVVREDVENVILALGPGGNLKGSIRVEQSVGQKIAPGGVRVQLLSMEGISINTPGVTSGDDGQFVIEGVGPEKYRVTLYSLPEGTWLKSVRAGEQEVLDTGLDLSAGVAGNIEITLATGAGQVSGVVQDAKQQPAPGSIVTLVPEPPKPGRNDLYRVATTDQNGQFTLQGIPPGDYKLFAWEDVEMNAHMDPEFLKPHQGKAQKTSVKPDSHRQVTLPQIPAEETGAP